MERLPAGKTRAFQQTISTKCSEIQKVRLQSANTEQPPAKDMQGGLKKAFTAFSMGWIAFEN